MTAPFDFEAVERKHTTAQFVGVVFGVERPACDKCSNPAYAALSHPGCTGLPALMCQVHTIDVRVKLANDQRCRCLSPCSDCNTAMSPQSWRVDPI